MIQKVSRKWLPAFLLLALTLFGFSAAARAEGVTITCAKSGVISGGIANMMVGDTVEFTADLDAGEMEDTEDTEDTEEPAFTWTSGDTGILTVSNSKTEKTTVKAVGVGTATLNVSVDGTNYTSSLQVKVILNAPKLKKAVVKGPTAITISWEPVEGADGYKIWRKKSTEANYDTKAVGEVNGKDTTFFTDTTCEYGVQYTYSVSAFCYQGAGKYTGPRMKAGITAKKTSIPTVTLVEAKPNSSGGIVVSWQEVDGAEKYRVYRKTTGGAWGRIAEIEPAASYTDDSVSPGETYIYTVRAMYGAKLGGYDAAGVSAQAVLAQPRLIGTLSKSDTELSIMWEKVEGADLYRVYRRDKTTGKWITLTKKCTDVRYTAKNLEPGEEYNFTVRAGVKVNGKIVLSGFENEIIAKTVKKASQVTFSSPKLIGASALSTSGIAVTWESVAEAEGYYIYRKTSGTSWKKVGTVNGRDITTWTDTRASFGTTYTYTVRAWVRYGTKIVRSINYDTKGVTASAMLAAPKLKSATPNLTSSITLTWEKVSGAEGYNVYRKTADSGWKSMGKVNGTSAIDKTIQKNITYTYTVRAYVTVDGKTVFGAYDPQGISCTAKITSQTKNGLVLYYDGNGKLITDTTGILGSQSSYQIEVDYNKNVVTVYAKGSSGSYNTPVKAFVCSTGKATPIGTFRTPKKYRWRELNGNVYGQWCTRIHGGVLFHSVYYMKYNNNMSLAVGQYNKLGTKCSHGCVRLTARDAKWIYDNCKLGTAVKVKTSCANPFGKPSSYKLSKSHTWDPTDPNAYYKCKERGCH